MDADHDLLIELKTMFKMAHEENQRSFGEHKTEDTKSFTELSMKVNAAHSRMDALKKEMTESIERLSQKMNSFLSLKDKIMGGACVIMFLITTGLSIFSVLKK